MARDDWSYKDIENFYDRVRMSLSAASTSTLPDEYIDYPEKAPFAESIIKARVPLWSELDDNKFAIFESIIVYQTASLFQSLVSSKTVKKKQIPTITLEYSENIDFGVNGMGLSDLVDFLVSELNGENAGSNFFGFLVTKGGFRYGKV